MINFGRLPSKDRIRFLLGGNLLCKWFKVAKIVLKKKRPGILFFKYVYFKEEWMLNANSDRVRCYLTLLPNKTTSVNASLYSHVHLSAVESSSINWALNWSPIFVAKLNGQSIYSTAIWLYSILLSDTGCIKAGLYSRDVQGGQIESNFSKIFNNI